MTHLFTVDPDEDTGAWKVTKRDPDGMPLDERPYSTKHQASRAASNSRYSAKTYRPAVRR